MRFCWRLKRAQFERSLSQIEKRSVIMVMKTLSVGFRLLVAYFFCVLVPIGAYGCGGSPPPLDSSDLDATQFTERETIFFGEVVSTTSVVLDDNFINPKYKNRKAYSLNIHVEAPLN